MAFNNPEHVGRVVPRVMARLAPRDLYAGMNRLEKEYAIALEAQKRSGQILEWWYERYTFKLADDTRYTPDFVVQELSGALRVDETKGFWKDDARVKIKVFAAQFPMVVRGITKERGAWKVEDFTQGLAA